ncbi:hypothetical protein WJX73_010901 [Symbiochloris irregularis]|uniref:Alpha-(1,6)-fucosyltransferase N- and catalytic domain-containing protein n=1 Tax=Symbiochloris irregularis TaxID=706552 RepID=A0AAW1Q4S2_9CHLO
MCAALDQHFACLRLRLSLTLLLLAICLVQAASEPRINRHNRATSAGRRSHLDHSELALNIRLAERTHHHRDPKTSKAEDSFQTEQHGTDTSAIEQESRPVPSWDGGEFWMHDNKRTLYFEPIAGLGNRLRGLASAIIVAKEFNVGFRLIWRAEPVCEGCHQLYQPFVSSWEDLFVEPPIRRADNFPGSNMTIFSENSHLVPKHGGRGHPPDNCTIHWVESYDELVHVMETGWEMVQGEEVVCAKGTSWLTRRGEYDAAPFFFKLRPSVMVQQQVDDFKASVRWDLSQWICAHIRRTDLRIFNESGIPTNAGSLISVSNYTDRLRELRDAGAPDKLVRIFVASDDPSAEDEVASGFPEGVVLSASKADSVYTRGSVAGIQAALTDIILLSSCPVLVGTFYSSYSETAKLLGGGYYVQVGGHLLASAKVHKFGDVARDA